MTGVRGDVVTNDVFISWTGADRAVKDAVKKHLQGVFTSIESDENVICTNEGMSVTDSARDCSGNYEEWSLQAAEASHIFLLILSKNSITGSIYQPVELQAFKKIAGADYKNRIVTLCQSDEVYNSERFGEKGEHLLDKVSAVYCDFDNLSGKEFAAACKDLSGKIQNLLINRAFEIHKQACLESENSLEVLSALATSAVGDRAISFDKLYIPRYAQEGDGLREDDNKEDLTPMQMLARGRVLLVHAPSGMGKTQYIKQVRRALYEEDGETYMSVLRCTDVARSNKSVYELLCEEYKGKCRVKNLNEKHFARIWETHNRLIVFDGLDEIPTIASTRNFMEKVGELDKMYCAERKMSTQFLFTSRNAADKDRISVLDKAGAHAFKLKELVEEDIESLCDKLQDTLSIRKGFYVEIQTLEDEIKTNPLLLTQLAIIYKSEGQIPGDRLDIMEKIAEIMCSLEDRADKKILRVNDIDFDGEDIRKIMEEFSAIYFEDKDNSEDSEIMEETLKNLGGKFEDIKAKYVLEYLKKRAIYSEGRYLHRNLGEYFAACRYAKSIRRSKSDDEKQKIITPVLAHCGEENWVNIINWTVRKSKIKRIDIPEGVSEIPSGQFERCNFLEYITIPDSATSVGVGAFADCNEKIFEVEDGIKYIGKWIIECDERVVRNINIKDGCLGIAYGAFSTCGYFISSITIPSSVTSIGDYAFSHCSDLTSITIPDSVTSIGSNAFSNCNGLTSITVEQGNSKYHSAGNCIIETASKTLVVGCKNSVIPDDGSVTSIGSYAFYGCSGLTNINILDSIISIGKEAFAGCSGLTSINIPNSIISIGEKAFVGCSKLQSIAGMPSGKSYYVINNSLVDRMNKTVIVGCGTSTIPNDGSVTNIGEKAFYNCSGLISIIIPKNIVNIGKQAFASCTDLISITVEQGNTAYHSANNCLIETASKTLIAGCKNSIIPDDGSVTSIGEYAFSGCNGLTSITIPDSVTSIGRGAFYGCRDLTSIFVPDSVIRIGSLAFFNCNNAVSIVIGNRVIIIGNGAFSHCSDLKYIAIPDCVTRIGAWTFIGCSGLKSITIPDSVTSIGRGAFYRCSGLTSITIPGRVTSIGSDAFSHCSGLTSITIPDSVTSIGEYAFDYCDNLTVITYMGTKEQWGKIKKEEAWKDSDRKITVTCMDGVIVE